MTNISKDEQYPVRHRLSPRQIEIVLAGGHIPLLTRDRTRRTLAAEKGGRD